MSRRIGKIRIRNQENDNAQDNEETNKTDEDIKQESNSPNKTQTIGQNESEILFKKALLNKNKRIERLRSSNQNVREV
ncbi:unnamed protein product [Brachionus calyciflorus]|uniref:Uncharacterized protein n=1 Tax=Brachionus calyciflorus TaxID=104777 RepID=A0A814DF77_9BILA|nr:unnamed protein product [Brachionus calyciflorus]